jgi:Spy/CpxP family protein refolding chaperone
VKNNGIAINHKTQSMRQKHMNRTTFSLLAGVVLGSLMAGGAMAQAPTTNLQRAATATNAPGMRPAMRDRTDYWAQRLSLTEEQKLKVKPVFDEETQKMTELRKQQQLKPEERRTKLLAIREETNAKLKTILTPEQWEKYTKPFAGRTNAPPTRPTPPAAPAAPAAPAK